MLLGSISLEPFIPIAILRPIVAILISFEAGFRSGPGLRRNRRRLGVGSRKVWPGDGAGAKARARRRSARRRRAKSTPTGGATTEVTPPARRTTRFPNLKNRVRQRREEGLSNPGKNRPRRRNSRGGRAQRGCRISRRWRRSCWTGAGGGRRRTAGNRCSGALSAVTTTNIVDRPLPVTLSASRRAL
jgi:hypothetical protein